MGGNFLTEQLFHPKPDALAPKRSAGSGEGEDEPRDLPGQHRWGVLWLEQQGSPRKSSCADQETSVSSLAHGSPALKHSSR